MKYLLVYTIIGILWSGILEHYTTTKLKGIPIVGTPWEWGERIFSIVLWPIGVFIFVQELVKGYFNKK